MVAGDSSTGSPTRPVRVVIEVDGLLTRFGRVVPDAVGMLAELQRLRGTVEATPRAPTLDISSIRFDPRAAGAGHGGGRPILDAAGLLGPLIDDGGEVCDVSALLESAGPARLVLMTPSEHRLVEAASAGLEAFRVGPGTRPEQRGLTYDNVPQAVADLVRIPTARPMAPGTSTGGLVAIPVGSPHEARARIYDALLEDRSADWVTAGSHLLLYTEQPDLEDRLAEEPGAEHISYAVRRDELWFGAPTDDALYSTAGLAIYEQPPAAAADRSPWLDVRRSSIWAPPGERARAPGTIERIDRAFRREYPPAAEAIATPDGTAATLDVVRGLLGAAAAPDLHHMARGSAISWTTPFGTDDRDEILLIIHQDPSATGVAAAIALARAMTSAAVGAGVLHCAWVSGAGTVGELVDRTLLVEERHSLRATITAEHVDRLASGRDEPEFTISEAAEDSGRGIRPGGATGFLDVVTLLAG